MWKRTTTGKNNRVLVILGFISALILTGYIIADNILPEKVDTEKALAISYMSEMINAVSDYCIENNIQIDKTTDPKETGLIGPEWTDMTTTIGHLEAKRTSLNPEFASLMVSLFREAHLKKGDEIALGCSGSFPGLLLASLASAKAMGLNCKTIISLGSSSYGANRLDLNMLDIFHTLINRGLINKLPVGISLGGEGDIGSEWDNDIRNILINKIELSNIPFIYKENLIENVDQRVDLLGFKRENPPKVFINAGGATANIGTSTSILHLKPGLINRARIPPVEQQGLLHFALRNDIPVIHLLYIKGLVFEYDLHWDHL